MTTIWSSCCALDALIAIFLSVPSRNGSCCNRTALCPLFRDVNCIECEVYYVKLLTVIHEVYKRLTKICASYIFYFCMEMAHRCTTVIHPYVDGAHWHLAPQLFINLNHSLTPNLLHCSSCCLLWAFISGSCLNTSLCTALSPLGPRPPLGNDPDRTRENIPECFRVRKDRDNDLVKHQRVPLATEAHKWKEVAPITYW